MNLEKIRSFFKTENVTKATNLSLIILVIAGGYFIYQNYKKTPTKITTTIPNPIEEVSTSLITIDIGGAVNKPGVYELPTGSRIIDAVKISGGFSDKADQKFIDKNINKAQKLSDGIKIYFPSLDEQQIASVTIVPTTGSSGIVNINSASKQDLVNLSEIGEVTADKIIAARPFANLDELVSKKCISQSQLDKIKDKISI